MRIARHWHLITLEAYIRFLELYKSRHLTQREEKEIQRLRTSYRYYILLYITSAAKLGSRLGLIYLHFICTACSLLNLQRAKNRAITLNEIFAK